MVHRRHVSRELDVITSRVSWVSSDLTRLVDGSDVAGCAVARLRRDEEPEFIFLGSCEAGGASITSEVLWEAASLGKPVVALLAASLVRENPTHLEQPLSTDLAAWGADGDDRWNDISLLHLLTHTSGLPNWREDGALLGFDSDPGTPGYSGEGYELMLSELSVRSGSAAGSLLDRHLAALHMHSSTFTADPTKQLVMALGHDAAGTAVPKQHWSEPKAASSLHTTVEDYARFLLAIARPDEVSDPALRDAAFMLAVRQTELLPGFGRTLGWAFIEGDHGDVLWQHGDNPGFKHVAAVCPSTGEAIVVFTNDESGQTLYRDLCRDFLEVEVW